jgi:hypothetical protein
MQSTRTATCVWPIDAALVLALDAQLGPPVDSYVNGSQVWLTDEESDRTLEWRLHPVSGYWSPRDLSHYDLWERVVGELSGGADPGSLSLGRDRRPLTSLWDGLECFAPFDELEPAVLAAMATQTLGIAPPHVGMVDHQRIGDAWEQARGTVSIVALLLEQLEAPQPPAS